MNTEEQFSALEIVLGKKESFISFGGTDDTLIGWKEDFNMCFLSPIPAQTDAKAYLEDVCRKGAERASWAAEKTLRKVYKKVGFYQPGK